MQATDGWFAKHVRAETAKDRLAGWDRVGQLVGVAIGLIFAWYFLDLYWSDSGFFTDAFDDADAVLFFGLAFLGVVPGLLKAILGRRNVTRPAEVALAVAMLAAAAWFLDTFPFDFDYLSEGLPESLRFLVDWIDDDIAKIFLTLAIIINVFIIPYTVALYLGVRRALAGGGS